MADTDKRIRDAINASLQAQNRTVHQVAEELGVTPSAVYQILSGKRGRIPESLLRLLKVVGLELYTRPSPPEPEDS